MWRNIDSLSDEWIEKRKRTVRTPKKPKKRAEKNPQDLRRGMGIFLRKRERREKDKEFFCP